MSSGRHAGFMAGEEEGVPAAGDPRHRDGRLRGFPEVWTPPPNLGGLGWLRLRGAGLRTWIGKGREGRHGGCWAAWGAFSWHIRDVPETLLFASGPPGTILESNCLLIPSGCN